MREDPPRTLGVSIDRRRLMKMSGLGLSGVAAGGLGLFPTARELGAGDHILLNQIGFGRKLNKTAVILSELPIVAGRIEFDVVDISGVRETVRESFRLHEAPSLGSQHARIVDLSDLTRPGSYVLQSGDVKSPEFEIGHATFDQTVSEVLRGIHSQRCGVATVGLDGNVGHRACHERDGLLAVIDEFNEISTSIRCKGGWHDAGDYGKYVATTSTTIGSLISAHDEAPDYCNSLPLGLGSTADDLPDYLQIVDVGCQWLLTMQRADGPFYRKVSGVRWPAMDAAPEDDRQQRFVFGISSYDTALAVAALANAARAFGAHDFDKSRKYGEAALRGWQYLDEHDYPFVDEGKADDAGSGRYLLPADRKPASDHPHRFWAAVSLYRLTGENQYQTWFQRLFPQEAALPDWSNPTVYGLEALVSNAGRKVDKRSQRRAKALLLGAAEFHLRDMSASAFQVVNGTFDWGSNRVVAEAGKLFHTAYQLTGKARFADAAVGQADYILGRNPHDMSFVTGQGKRWPMNVHHRLSISSKQTAPGLVVGGPNATEGAEDLAPILRYRDDTASFKTNEPAIDYAASFLSLLIPIAAQARERSVLTRLIDRVFGIDV